MSDPKTPTQFTDDPTDAGFPPINDPPEQAEMEDQVEDDLPETGGGD